MGENDAFAKHTHVVDRRYRRSSSQTLLARADVDHHVVSFCAAQARAVAHYATPGSRRIAGRTARFRMLCARTVRATAPARAPAPAPARRFRVRAVVPRATGSDGDRASDPPTTRRVALGVALASSAAALAAPLVSPAPARAADASDWSSPGLGVVPDQPANYQRTPLGVVYEQINDGVGEPAKAGDVAVFQWILRRANGYFIYGTIDCGIGCGNGDPSEYKLGPDGKLIAGLDELLTGMRPGEKRRALIPPAAGYVSKGLEPQPPEFGQKRQVEVHASEPLVFEVKLVKTRQRP